MATRSFGDFFPRSEFISPNEWFLLSNWAEDHTLPRIWMTNEMRFIRSWLQFVNKQQLERLEAHRTTDCLPTWLFSLEQKPTYFDWFCHAIANYLLERFDSVRGLFCLAQWNQMRKKWKTIFPNHRRFFFVGGALCLYTSRAICLVSSVYLDSSSIEKVQMSRKSKVLPDEMSSVLKYTVKFYSNTDFSTFHGKYDSIFWERWSAISADFYLSMKIPEQTRIISNR